MRSWTTGRAERRPFGWRSSAFDLVVALAATAFEVVTIVEVEGDPTAPGVALGIAGGGALILRRWAPLPVLGAAATAAVTITAIGDVPSGVPMLVALYTVAATCERRRSLAALAAAGIVVVILSVYAPESVGDPDPSVPVSIVTNTVLTIGVWALGAYFQTRRRYQRELEQRAERLEREREQLAQIAMHEERAGIARELHDIVAHSVAVMLVGVRGARDVLRSSPDVADDTLARVETSGEQSLAELRRILALLREPEQGAASRPQPSLAELDELVAEYADAGLPVRLERAGTPQPLPGGVELSVYRIVQEALTNVLKHARPHGVIVTLSYGASVLDVEVVDDGLGVTQAVPPVGHGIVGMRERVSLLGGELETGNRAGGGFRVAARLPLGGGA